MKSNDHRATPYGLWVRAQRERLGLSQTELARRVGLSSIQISNIETGRTKKPREETRHRLAQILGESTEHEACPVIGFPNAPKKAPQKDDGELSCSFCNRPLARAGAIAWLSDDRDPTACERCVYELNRVFAQNTRHDRNYGKAALRLVQRETQ